MKRILVAEDEESIRELVVFNLKRNGYTVVAVPDGTKALELYNRGRDEFDIALLDVMMPGIDGMQLSSILRKKSNTLGIILLTAKAQESDKVNGLLGGADDYITKPFSVSELMARVDAVYRRVSLLKVSEKTAEPNSDNSLIFGGFSLNVNTHTLTHNSNEIELTQIEFRIVQAFFSAEEHTVSRNELLTQVWGENFNGDDKVVDVNIRRLRMKIERDPSKPKYLVTLWGIGYRWNDD